LFLTITNALAIIFLKYDFILPLKSEIVESIKYMNTEVFGLYYLHAIIISPILEETLFRGILYVPLVRKVGRFTAIILTSLIWTEQHFQLGAGIRIFILGVILAWLYDRRGSLIDPIIFHIFTNCWLIIYYVRIL
jgi:membrane protease YdiL (CAAX protease family)